ncbi:chaperone protein DNAJ [Angomonas deanei]|uniref:DnaJ domain containing protein n=1 Tax=Angomonas deanei TaxID=59799 RepID=S9WTX1_9TRYP|nr:chaperone protein DNAJ [Angomonas deanei]EPY42905.1 chaperone protein DNAJ [Angomonas deanei]CAD2222599.1 hypothetical protein, conserved [Angomonas deanei]|eukprot:EPY39480.1 chaperone protein DNAJ [Angomonas deanei]
MLRWSIVRRMSIKAACDTMDFKVPPNNKKDLKTRFIHLAKERHPDQNHNSDAATTDMVRLTEAYKTLKKVIEEGVATRPVVKAEGATGEDMESVARSFVVPGSSVSLRGFTLPWQRAPTRTASTAAAEELLSTSTSFTTYVSGIRQAAADRRRREERIDKDAARSEGSHGFTAEHFAEMRRMKERMRVEHPSDEEAYLSTQGTSWVRLTWRYYGRKFRCYVKKLPQTIRESLRYIIH